MSAPGGGTKSRAGAREDGLSIVAMTSEREPSVGTTQQTTAAAMHVHVLQTLDSIERGRRLWKGMTREQQQRMLASYRSVQVQDEQQVLETMTGQLICAAADDRKAWG